MQDFLNVVAVSALMRIERDAVRSWQDRAHQFPDIHEDEDAVVRRVVQTAIYQTTELLEPNEIDSEEEWLSESYWRAVSS